MSADTATQLTDAPVTILSTISKSTVEFGPRWLTVARRDDDGTQVVWFSVKAQAQPNERWLVSGRIKKAGQHDGVAQVELTREMITFAQLPLGSYERAIAWIAELNVGRPTIEMYIDLVADLFGKEHGVVVYDVQRAQRMIV